MPPRRKMTRNQQKAMFAKMSYPQAKAKYPNLSPSRDWDKDGVPNSKDCKPFNPKEQGFLHDLQVRSLQKQEEKLERQREAEQRKLEDLRDKLKQKSQLNGKKQAVKEAQLKQKQAIIDEIKKEKDAAEKFRKENERVKKELDKFTLSGKLKNALSKGGKEVEERWNSKLSRDRRAVVGKKSKKLLIKTGKFISNFL